MMAKCDIDSVYNLAYNLAVEITGGNV